MPSGYYIETDGTVINRDTNQIIKPYHLKGYLHLTLYGKYNGDNKIIKKGFLVHRLVALAHIYNPDPERYPEVDHINFDVTDNRVENLRWISKSKNCKRRRNSLNYQSDSETENMYSF